MKKPSVTVLIVTYNRAQFLARVLSALMNQTYRTFDVLVIVKPSGDKTEDIVEKYTKSLALKMIIQKKGYVTNAINLGLENAKGDIIAFLDDDAIPFPDWIENLVETYQLPNVGGVAGDAIPAFINEEGNIERIKQLSEVFLDNAHAPAQSIWSSPLKGLEDYAIYISKAGIVECNNVEKTANEKILKSLLGMGANMSILNEATKGFTLPNSWVSGWGFEQFIGWYLWKRGYGLLINNDAKVLHLIHGQTLSRNFTDSRKQMLFEAEVHLFFYRLYGLEKDLSIIHRISWLLFRTIYNIKKAKNLKQVYILLVGALMGNMIGCKLVLKDRKNSKYDPIFELEALLGRASS